MTMKKLLEKDFISHYGLTVGVTVNIVPTDKEHFELKDDATLMYSSGSGIAKYENPTHKEVNIINYEAFFKSLPQPFQQNKRNCDLIVYTSDLSFFLLNELTETNPLYIPDFVQQTDGLSRIGKRNQAISQLAQTLKYISAVPTIDTFIQQHKTKHCCFFNKPPQLPTAIIAPIAFSRLSLLTPYGIHTRNSDIEFYGFEFWEFSTPQTYLLSVSVKNIAQQLSNLSAKEVKELAEILQQDIKETTNTCR